MAEEKEAALRVLQEELSNQKMLLENIGWKELMSVAQEQLQLRLPTVLKKTDNLLSVLPQEFEKGVISGIELFCALPGIRAEAIKDDIIKLEEELGYGPGERTERGTDGSRSDGDAGGNFEPAVPSV